jgi:hypothetical protein
VVGELSQQAEGREVSSPDKKQAPASKKLLAALPGISTLLMAGQPVKSELMAELGAILHAVSRGESAHTLFRQHEKTRPKVDRAGVALVYWYVRACTDDDALAVVKAACAQNFGRTGTEKPLTESYVRNVAKKHRDAVFEMLEGNPARATDRARIYMCNARQQWVLFHRGGDVAQGKLSPQEAAEVTELLQFKLTAKKVAALREYLRRKSPRKI